MGHIAAGLLAVIGIILAGFMIFACATKWSKFPVRFGAKYEQYTEVGP